MISLTVKVGDKIYAKPGYEAICRTLMREEQERIVQVRAWTTLKGDESHKCIVLKNLPDEAI